MDVWTYFMQKQGEFEEYSAYPQGGPDQVYEAEEGSGDQRGRMFVKLGLTDTAYIQVHERVSVTSSGSAITRDVYAYQLIIDGQRVHLWERDPTHDPPVHEHIGPDRTREASEPVHLKYVLKVAWEEISLRAEAPPHDQADWHR